MFLFISRGLRDLYGLEPDAVMQDSDRMWAAILPEDVPGFAESIQRAAEKGRQWNREWRITTTAGETKWIKGTASQERQQDGSLLWDGLLLDITELKRIAEERTKGSELLAVTLRSIGDAVISTDASGCVTFVNPTAEGLTGWTTAEALARPLAEVFDIRSEETGDRVENPLTRVFADGAVDYIVKPYDPVILRSKVNIFLQLDRQKQELRRHRALLEATNKELEAFAYSVSHDLQAPLRAVDGFSRALLEDYHDILDEVGQDHLRRVRANTQRMATLIDDLLWLSRLTRAEMTPQTLDLGRLAQEIAADLQRTEPDRRVVSDISAGISARGDRALPQTALDALLRNAWMFTSHHDCARIEFAVTEQREGPVYHVRDDGAGFDMAYAGKMFGVFQRLHDATEFPGSGLGLAIVQRVIQRHGGRVWTEGAVEGGATFQFTLPDDIPAPMKELEP